MDPANNGVCPAGCDDAPVQCTPVCAFNASSTTPNDGCPAGCTDDQTVGSESCTGTADVAAADSALCSAAGATPVPSCVGTATPVAQCIGTSTQDQICVDNVCTCDNTDGSSYGTAATAADDCSAHQTNICTACDSVTGWRCSGDECSASDADRGCEPSCVCTSGGIPSTSCTVSHTANLPLVVVHTVDPA